jgi:hypothetical protein
MGFVFMKNLKGDQLRVECKGETINKVRKFNNKNTT